MNILIVGNGFLANPIIQKLEYEGHDITVFSRTWNESIKARQILGDIFDFENFIKVLDLKPQVIIHTAWITTPGIYNDSIINFRYAEFTTKLANFIANSDVEHLVVLGSCAEYGLQHRPSVAGLTKLRPLTLYAQQKVVAFKAVKELLIKSDVRFTWARIFYPYGPNQDHRRLVPHLLETIATGNAPSLKVVSSIFAWITTRDVSSAVSWIISHELPNEIDVGTSFGFTNLELLTTIEKLLKVSCQYDHSRASLENGKNVFVAGRNSPLFISGWKPSDSLITGLEWMLRK